MAWHDSRGANYDIYIQRVSAAGVPLWTANGVVVCNATNDQANAQMISDGAGGVIVTWHDFRLGNWDIYAQRLNANGVAQWAANGVSICQWPFDQPNPHLVSDGQGGAILAWEDQRSIGSSRYDVYAQRVNAAGVLQWPNSGGIPVCSGVAGLRTSVRLIPDGSGGAIISWSDGRNASYDIFAQRVNGAGAMQWTANGAPVCTTAGSQANPSIAPDGLGGAYIAWQENIGLNSDILIQRVNPGGTLLWNANGIVMCNAADIQTFPQVIADGAGGVIVVWEDSRSGLRAPYAQRMNSTGSGLWTANGVNCMNAGGIQGTIPQLVSDGAGGAIVAWYAFTTGDISAQRVSASGATLWGSAGITISNAIGDQNWPMIAPDGAGGAIVSWHDLRNPPFYDAYAQRVDHYGNLGSPEPVITSVRDTPNDQGGKLKVSWNASYLDADPTFGIIEYRVWRSAPQAPLSGMLRAIRGITRDADEAAATGAFLAQSVSGVDYMWEYVATQPAAVVSGYSIVTSTTGDSVAGSNPRTVFAIEARAGTAVNANHWWSAPDSGYSVDNLPPAAPAPFTGAYAAGSTALHWARNGEADFAHYRLYRGSSAGFIPAPANLVASPPDTGYVDAGGTPFYYKLSAVDSHGNESAFALLAPSGTVGAPEGGVPVALRLGRPQPNPAAQKTRIEFDLPRAADVSLAVFDATGRAVRELVRGHQPAGAFGMTWDLRDDNGRRVGNGVYFVRLVSEGRTITQRMIAMR